MTKQELIRKYPHLCMEISSDYLNYSVGEAYMNSPTGVELEGQPGDKYWEDFLNHIDPLPVPVAVKNNKIDFKSHLNGVFQAGIKKYNQDQPKGFIIMTFKSKTNKTRLTFSHINSTSHSIYSIVGGHISFTLGTLINNNHYFISTIRRASDNQRFIVDRTYQTRTGHRKIKEIRVINGEVVAFLYPLSGFEAGPWQDRVLVKNLKIINKAW